MAKEVLLGWMAGLFDSLPLFNLQVSLLDIVSTRSSNQFRPIFHLSFRKSAITSINSAISNDVLVYSILPLMMLSMELNLGQGSCCFTVKKDIESAFRLILVYPEDYKLLGMYCEEKFNCDQVLPFGLWSAPFLVNQLSNAVEWTIFNRCKMHATLSNKGNFHSAICLKDLTCAIITLYDLLRSKFSNSGAPVKTQVPLQVLEFMGKILHTLKMEARLPVDKMDRIRTSLAKFKNKKSCMCLNVP